MESLSIIAPNAAGKKKNAAGFSTGSYSFFAQLSPAYSHSSGESRRWRDGGKSCRVPETAGNWLAGGCPLFFLFLLFSLPGNPCHSWLTVIRHSI
jgi:hypothetical protein